MKVIKLFLPGRFEDSYVYMGRLLVLTENRTLRMYNLDRIVDFLEVQFSGSLPVPTLMFLRNDWLESSQFKSLMKNKGMARSFLAAFEKFPQPFVELDEKAFRSEEQDLNIPARVLLDMLIYNKRLYVGADTGFYHIDMNWNQDTVTLQGKVKKRHDARCVSTSQSMEP
ncbi:MAG: hypothetical protein L0Y56_20540 [Nitrospira sp.]|nr:hypothetical protein [Nitrospira sp.]